MDFGSLLASIQRAERVILLRGSATEKMRAVFGRHAIEYEGPFGTFEETVHHSARDAGPGNSVLFSPGCASFELFLNEFDRNRTFYRLVAELVG